MLRSAVYKRIDEKNVCARNYMFADVSSSVQGLLYG